MSTTVLNDKCWIILIGWIYLHTLHYFDFTLYDPTLGGQIDKLICIILILYLITHQIHTKYAYSKNWVAGFLWVPMLSFISCWLEHGQDPIQSFWAYFPLFVLLLYFVFHVKKIESDKIINLLTLFAVVRTTILLIQQFTYPNYYFAFRPEVVMDNGLVREIEIRSGILRYYISDTYLSMFLVFYWGQKIFENFKWKYFLLFAWGVFGLWLDQTRQFMFVTFGTFIIVMLFSRNKKINKISIYTAIIISLIIIGLNFDNLFGELASKTNDEITKDNIRYIAYTYFFYEYWGGPLSVFLGNGIAGTSQYGKEIAYLTNEMHLYRADVGIVGFFNQYGIVSVFYFLMFYILFVRKNWKYMDAYIKMFLLSILLNLPLVVFFVNNLNWYTYMAFMMYLTDISIKKNKQLYL